VYVLLSFWVGYEAANNDVFPIGQFVDRNFVSEDKSLTSLQKKLDLFSDTDKKNEVKCPDVNDAYVIIGFGQSNSANHGGHRFVATKKKIYNFFNGRCYVASDPLLGATGRGGSVWIPLAEQLPSNRIVYATFGVGGTKLSQWLSDDSFIALFRQNVLELKKFYPDPDLAIWIQGESDKDTPKAVYEDLLRNWIGELRKELPTTRIAISGTSYCNGSGNKEITGVQEKLSDELGLTYLGATDRLTESSHRYDDCHFSERGLMALSHLLAKGLMR
jgi:hypothetical protein